jgi:hypothetical protein
MRIRHFEREGAITLRTRRFRQRQIEKARRAAADSFHLYPQLLDFYQKRKLPTSVWITTRDIPTFLDFQKESSEDCLETATLHHNGEKLDLIRPLFLLRPVVEVDEDQDELSSDLNDQ